MELFEKLFIARTVLALSQEEAAAQAGVKQATISKLERGEKEGVPEIYINFLYNKGIDLNWIFNKDENTRNIFREDHDAVNFKNEIPLQGSTVLHPPAVDGHFFMTRELLETKKLTYSGIKQVDKVLNELLTEIKKLNTGLLQHTDHG